MRTLTLIILLVIWPSAAYSWQWRITERANCANGQCVASPARESSKVEVRSAVRMDGVLLPGASNDCPDGRCPLVKRTNSVLISPQLVPNNTPVAPLSAAQPDDVHYRRVVVPTLAPPEPQMQAKPLRSVCKNCKPKQRVFNGPIARWLRGGK